MAANTMEGAVRIAGALVGGGLAFRPGNGRRRTELGRLEDDQRRLERHWCYRHGQAGTGGLAGTGGVRGASRGILG